MHNLLQSLVPVVLALICQLVVNENSSAVYEFIPRTMILKDYDDPIAYLNSGKHFTFQLAEFIPWFFFGMTFRSFLPVVRWSGCSFLQRG